VRETIQNSLDAKRPENQCVEVSFNLLENSALNWELVAPYVAALQPHLNACGIENDFAEFVRPSVLVVEDFGTGGLQGKTDEDDGDDFSLIKETRFRSLILPEVFRTVLTQILSSSLDENDDYSEISERWFKFAAILSSDEPPTLDDRSVSKIQEWVQGVIKPFSAKHQFFDHWKEAINPSIEDPS
jgi:hypothetical protein